jgi:hypothetical protein
MQYLVTRLDGRHSWREDFEHMLEFSSAGWSGTGVLEFDRARRWMHSTWGHSQEVHVRQRIQQHIMRLHSGPVLEDPAEEINPHWSYSVEYKNYRIYLKGDQELSWFQLAHASSGG